MFKRKEKREMLEIKIRALEDSRNDLFFQVRKLNNIIVDAIEYIEQQYKYEETAKEDYDILLDILKGDDKE